MLASICQLYMEIQDGKSHQIFLSFESPHLRVKCPTGQGLAIAYRDKPLSWAIPLNSINLRLLSSFIAKEIKVIHQTVPHISWQIAKSGSRVKEPDVPIVAASYRMVVHRYAFNIEFIAGACV